MVPFIFTFPAAIKATASLREHTPQCAINLFNGITPVGALSFAAVAFSDLVCGVFAAPPAGLNLGAVFVADSSLAGLPLALSAALGAIPFFFAILAWYSSSF